MIKFSQEKVLLLHKLMTEATGGAAGVRDYNLLDSALESAFQTFDGKELYPSKQEKAARLENTNNDTESLSSTNPTLPADICTNSAIYP